MSPCKCCGNDKEPRFLMQKVFTTYRSNVFVVLCGECKTHGETLAMVAPYYESQDDTVRRAEALWDEAHK